MQSIALNNPTDENHEYPVPIPGKPGETERVTREGGQWACTCEAAGRDCEHIRIFNGRFTPPC